MIIPCPHCGRNVLVKGLGRPPRRVPVKNICDALRAHRTVTAAAQELGVSRALVYKVLEANGLKLKDVAKTKEIVANA